MNNTTYSAGTISVGAGSSTVTGVGTTWATSGVRAGDALLCAGLMVVIASVASNTSLTLKRPWPGAAQSGVAYDILLLDDEVRSLVAANELLQALSGGTLTSLGQIAGAANKMPYWTGVGTMGMADLTSQARTLLASTLLSRSGNNLVTESAARITGGAVMENTTDVTPGRLVRTRDFGLGIAVSLLAENNLNDVIRSGFYYNGAGANTVGNNYPINSAGALVVVAIDATRCVQTYTTYGASLLASGTRTFVRSGGASGWTAWWEIFHQGSILGTVSQSGGVPTGRVIERGSNANGEYVKFADGAMICTRQINLGSVLAEGAGTTANPYRTASVTATFPAAFITPPRVSLAFPVTGSLNVADRILVPAGFDALATGIASLRVARVAGTNAASDILCDITAIGRWF